MEFDHTHSHTNYSRDESNMLAEWARRAAAEGQESDDEQEGRFSSGWGKGVGKNRRKSVEMRAGELVPPVGVLHYSAGKVRVMIGVVKGGCMMVVAMRHRCDDGWLADAALFGGECGCMECCGGDEDSCMMVVVPGPCVYVPKGRSLHSSYHPTTSSSQGQYEALMTATPPSGTRGGSFSAPPFLPSTPGSPRSAIQSLAQQVCGFKCV